MLIIISKTLPITTVKPTPNRNGRQRPFYGKTKKIDIHEKIITIHKPSFAQEYKQLPI